LPAAGDNPLQLFVQHNGNELTLTWPECPNAVLEQADGLVAPINWTGVTNEVNIAGGQKTVTITPTGNAGYFRLRQDGVQ